MFLSGLPLVILIASPPNPFLVPRTRSSSVFKSHTSIWPKILSITIAIAHQYHPPRPKTKGKDQRHMQKDGG
nr:uncharacterized protein LOC121502918 isoform X2 [Drosophila kikkawai]XP_041632985.1 uncharacterized protein LOC121502918 isoform X2 [Drosophila kikkawai]